MLLLPHYCYSTCHRSTVQHLTAPTGPPVTLTRVLQNESLLLLLLLQRQPSLPYTTLFYTALHYSKQLHATLLYTAQSKLQATLYCCKPAPYRIAQQRTDNGNASALAPIGMPHAVTHR